MNEIKTVKIKKPTLTGCLLWLLIMLPFFFGTLNDLLGLPWSMRYVLDLTWIALLGLMIRRRRYTGNWKVGGLIIWVMLFLLYTVLVYILQYQSVLYYLWGARNNFRFYVVFFAFMAFLPLEDAEGYLKTFDLLFWINVLVSLFQFLILDLEGDFLGGLFGADKGVNSYTNFFFLIIVTRSVIFYLNKKESIFRCLSKCAAALLIASLAELKFFFVEFILMILLASLLTDFSWRKVWIILGSVVAVVFGVILLTKLFPSFAGWFTVNWFLENAFSSKGYTSTGDLNRLNAIPQMNLLWLRSAGQRIFGLGLGNCDTSSFSFLNTPFFNANGDMHYSWMSYAFMYLECGWIGLVFYWGYFVLLFFRFRKLKKKDDPKMTVYCQMAEIMAVLCTVISVYNNSLRTEAAYMVYFVLAIPFALNRSINHRRKRLA